ncbi:tricin synthase 1-like isoform X2 [Alnus glutinosa]|uniref:tricin synthase 1-like isoform X2 n=1 Tax=Alnus glutinosa TaxID=3517 RepID=UPI002D78CFBC|nr:tricin synthase 1-like isoform X2 [Alnus glutinosa]
MATSSGLVLHRCWSMLAYRGVAFPRRSPRLMLNFHSVCATATATFATSLEVKASSDRCSSRFGTRACSSKSNQPTRRCSANAIVVVDDEKYGNKQVISVTPRLYDYILANVREPEILRQLREETASMHGSQMQVSPDQAQLLAMLVQILRAERCIEVGVYTGYSSLAIALVLPETGRLVACERDAKSLEVAKKYYERAGVLHKVDVKYGLAADALKSLILKGDACSFDFAFVDAEKRMNREYFELLLQLVRVGGLIVIDNVLWHGKVADTMVNDVKTDSIRNFNKHLLEDKRVNISMVPIGDGMTICQKR